MKKIFKSPFNFTKHYLMPFKRMLKDRKGYNRKYDPVEFFEQFYAISDTSDDRVTISPDYPQLHAKFHYNMVENGIMSYFKEFGVIPKTGLDVGSGTGHWVDFYTTVLQVEHIYGVDIARGSVERLKARFEGNSAVTILHGDVLDQDAVPEQSLDLINAIGVLFHIVDDQKWEETLCWCYSRLRHGGIFVAGGLMGMVTANVQFEPIKFSTVEDYRGNSELVCNKRVRSRRYWKKALRNAGFKKIVFRSSDSPSHISTPENNLVFAHK